MQNKRIIEQRDLINICKHLSYEIRMFYAISYVLNHFERKLNNVLGIPVVWNALIESFTIHTRVLLDFFYLDRPNQPDDVIACDFFNEKETWINNRPKKTELLKRTSKRVGKEVAHLTYKRVEITENDKQWHFGKISTDILQVFIKFIELLPDSPVKKTLLISLQEIVDFHKKE